MPLKIWLPFIILESHRISFHLFNFFKGLNCVYCFAVGRALNPKWIDKMKCLFNAIMRFAILYVNCFPIKSVNDIQLCEFPYTSNSSNGCIPERTNHTNRIHLSYTYRLNSAFNSFWNQNHCYWLMRCFIHGKFDFCFVYLL